MEPVVRAAEEAREVLGMWAARAAREEVEYSTDHPEEGTMIRDPYDEADPLGVIATLTVIVAAVVMVALLGLLIALIARGGA